MLGDSWVNLGRPNAGESGVMDLLNLGDGIVLAGTWAPGGGKSRYYRSIDYGVNWMDKGTLVRAGLSVWFTNCGGGVIVAGRSRVQPDVERSADYGLTFTYIQTFPGFLDGATRGCYCGSNIVLLGANTGGWLNVKIVYKSTDKGLTWDTGKAPTADTMTAVNDLIWLGGGIALASLGNGEIARTTDTGANWTAAVKDFGPDEAVRFVKLSSGAVLCILESSGDVWKSTNNGLNWSLLSSIGQPAFSMTYGGGMIFVGAGPTANVYRSIDDGVSWTDLGSLKTLFGIGSISIRVQSLAYGITDTETFLIAGLGGIAGDSYICRSGIEVLPAIPVADFSAEPRKGKYPFTVHFTDLSTGDPLPTSWLWHFGDREISQEQNPIHIYKQAGLYTVSLTATNEAGSDTETKFGYIEAVERAFIEKRGIEEREQKIRHISLKRGLAMVERIPIRVIDVRRDPAPKRIWR